MLDQTLNLLSDFAAGVSSLVFPSRCCGCERIDQPPLCYSCRTLLESVDPDNGCTRCCEKLLGAADTSRKLCRRCREHPPEFVQVLSAYRYAYPLNSVIGFWKYHDQRYLSDFLSSLLSEWVTLKEPQWWSRVDAIVPVPHHPKTLKYRGFSPSEDIARSLASNTSLPCMPRVLFKVRFTPPQNGLDSATRIANLKNSMKVFDRELVENRTLLMIDDVMTTGATLRECSRALIDAGASSVYCLTLARQSAGKMPAAN
jgi:competence protein ComFC